MPHSSGRAYQTILPKQSMADIYREPPARSPVIIMPMKTLDLPRYRKVAGLLAFCRPNVIGRKVHLSIFNFGKKERSTSTCCSVPK
jgi:hypothetical protein